MNRIYRILRTILIIIISLTIVFFVNGAIEMVLVRDKIEEFKARAEYVSEDVVNNIIYYRVEAKYDYEDISRNIFNKSTRIIGSTGDVVLTNRNPMRDAESPLLRISVGFLAHNFYLGHATLITSESGNRMLETIGNSSNPDLNTVTEGRNDWLTSEESLGVNSHSPIIMGLRIKNTTEEQRTKIVEYAREHIGKSYNYTFLFNRANTYYCTDLVSRATQRVGINLNYDYLATTGNDIIISHNVYIFFLREIVEIDGEKVFKYYFLD